MVRSKTKNFKYETITNKLAKKYLTELIKENTTKPHLIDHKLVDNLYEILVKDSNKVVLCEDRYPYNELSTLEKELSQRYNRPLAYTGSKIVIPVHEVGEFIKRPNLTPEMRRYISKIKLSPSPTMYEYFDIDFDYRQLHVGIYASDQKVNMAITPEKDKKFFVDDLVKNNVARAYAENLCM